jgi:hypothetical protein
MNSRTDENVSVMIEPLPGHSDEEVLGALEDAGIVDASVLAPGFISAHGHPDNLRAIERIACIHAKPQKQMRAA